MASSNGMFSINPFDVEAPEKFDNLDLAVQVADRDNEVIEVEPEAEEEQDDFAARKAALHKRFMALTDWTKVNMAGTAERYGLDPDKVKNFRYRGSLIPEYLDVMEAFIVGVETGQLSFLPGVVPPGSRKTGHRDADTTTRRALYRDRVIRLRSERGLSLSKMALLGGEHTITDSKLSGLLHQRALREDLFPAMDRFLAKLEAYQPSQPEPEPEPEELHVNRNDLKTHKRKLSARFGRLRGRLGVPMSTASEAHGWPKGTLNSLASVAQVRNNLVDDVERFLDELEALPRGQQWYPEDHDEPEGDEQPVIRREPPRAPLPKPVVQVAPPPIVPPPVPDTVPAWAEKMMMQLSLLEQKLNVLELKMDLAMKGR